MWRSAAVTLPGRARVGHWLSGPLTPASGRVTSLHWDADGEVTVQVRFERDAAPDTWNAWTIAPTSARSMPLGFGVRRVQVLATFAGDGVSTPSLRSVTLDCAP